MKYKVTSPMRACPKDLLGVYIAVGQSEVVNVKEEDIENAKRVVVGLQAELLPYKKSKADVESD